MEQKPVTGAGIIPRWVWTLVAVIVLGLVTALFIYDTPPEPDTVLQYTLPPIPPKAPSAVSFKELAGFPVDIPSPSAMGIGQDGSLFVGGGGVILRLNPEGKETGRINVKEQPTCLAICPKGSPSADELLVGMRNHIEVYNSNGESVTVWPNLDEKGYITSLAANQEGVFAADAGNRIVLFYGHDGVLKTRIGAEDKARDIPGFIVPSPYFDLALDPSGVFWVVNPGRHGLESYRSNGDPISSWYRMGMDLPSFCGCCNPIHIAFRPDGSLVTLEKGLDRVKLYAPDNTLLGVVLDMSATKTKEDAMSCTDEPPFADLAVDVQNRVYILDRVKKAVRIFEQQKAM